MAHRPPPLTVTRKKRLFGISVQATQDSDAPISEHQKIGGDSPFSSENDDDFATLCDLNIRGYVQKIIHKSTGTIMVRKTTASGDVPMRQLKKEFHFAAGVDHCNIVKFYRAYSSPTDLKILMEFCEGLSLDLVEMQIIKIGLVIEESTYGRLAEGILQGLNYLHGRKIIHRNIAPENIFLSREGIVKLAGFSNAGVLLNSFAATITGGTTMYLAPERIVGAEYTIRSEVWSTGITMLELILGRCPFKFALDLGPIEMLMYITNEDPPQLEDENGRHWSDQMKDFFKQMLNADHHVRPTPKEILQHEWITTAMGQEVDMARWIQTVWGWNIGTPL